MRFRLFATVLSAIAVFSLSAASVAAADPGWVKRALGLQYELGSDVGFANAPWIGTHNSFNSTAEMGQTLSTQDSNQQITIVEQLEQGMRSIEIDVHRFATAQGGGVGPVVCHARSGSEAHAGCTAEKPLGEVLAPIADWVRANPDQVLMIYVNDYLDNEDGYDDAARIFEQELGFGLYRPPAPGVCTELPLKLTREAIRDSGASVFVVSGCGFGAAWPSVAFSWSEHEESRPFGFTDFPRCGPDYSRERYQETLIRYYEDSTQLTQHAGTPDDGIDANTAARMSRCGVDLIHFDQLLPDDPRLAGLVWSWAPQEPRRRRCSVQRIGERVPFGRWKSRRCSGTRPAACRRPESGRWLISAARLRFNEAKRHCRSRRAAFAVPRTGYEAQLLRRALERNDLRGAWLGQKRRRDSNSWRSIDPR